VLSNNYIYIIIDFSNFQVGSFIEWVEDLLTSSVRRSVRDIVAVFECIRLGVSNGEEESGIFASVQDSVLVEVNLGQDAWKFFVAIVKGLH